MTSHQAEYLAKVSEKLAEMPNTRAKLSAGASHWNTFPLFRFRMGFARTAGTAVAPNQ